MSQRQMNDGQVQYRSKQKGGSYEQATPFFFTNFPEDWSYAEMWRTFLKFGRVYDIYCPKRKSRNGTKFGFVRFLDVKNSKELEKNLDQIWIRGRKLWVNLPRFEEGKSAELGSRYCHIAEPKNHNRSYAEVVKGQSEENQVEKGRTQTKKQEEKRPERSLSSFYSKQRSEENRTVWIEKGRGESWAGFEYNAKPEDYAWLEGCFVGVVHSVELVRNLQEKFYMEGYFSCRIRAMGGRLVLLDGEDKEELKDLVELASDWLGQWFEEVRPWTSNMVANESTSKRRRFDVARFLISTQIMDTIKVSRQVKINGNLYNLKFSEEEVSNCFFSLKQDFLPSFQSDEEDYESWSLGSVMETQDCDNAEEEVLGHENLVREEDDDVAWVGQDQEQPTREEVMLGKPTDGRSSQFRIQNSNGDKSRATDKFLEQEKVASVPVLQVGISDGSQMGSKNKSKRKEDKEPSEQQSTNMGLAQDRRKEVMADPIVNRVSSGIMEISEDINEEEEDDAFWRGFEKDKSRVEEWINKQIGESSMRKRRKARSCSSVYQCSEEDGGAPSESGSVGDSGIMNYNRSIKEQMQSQLAKEIWDLAKQLGANAENDAEVLQKIEEMEKRDYRIKGDMAKSDTGGAKKIREIVLKEKVDFIAIQETKLVTVDRKICRIIWGTDDFDWVAKPSVGRSGGLLCIWNAKVLKKMEVIEGNNFIGISALWGEERISVYILNIYSPCQLMGKRILWDDLQGLINSKKGNWCLAGDFNAVRGIEERAGETGVNREMQEFDNFISNSALIDLPLLGRKYTWYNSNGQYMSRIDRFLLSEDWVSKWGDVKQWGLRRSVSDHCPILLKNEKIDWGPKPFKFFDAWFEKLGCMELITSVWKSKEVQGQRGFILKEKLKRTKRALKEWSRNLAVEVDDKVKEAESVIAEIDEKGESNQLTEEDIERRRSSFMYTGVKEIKEEVAMYFKDLFSEVAWQRPKLDWIRVNQISQADNEMLVVEFDEKEIKEAIWDCCSSKAPGPDGFNFGFVKKMWEDIKVEVIDFVQEFWEYGRIARGSNASFIVLIPKKENPQGIEDYRPISLIGIMYKIIAKLLANQLRRVLPKVIGEQQMAFIEGRQLADGVVIANEVIDEAKRKRKKSFLFKVDFEKAYDKVCWSFLEFMMMRMGFSKKWRKWIQECLRSSSVSVLINGSPTKEFPVSKGICQGDPLSPFLFLIVAEGLNGLVSATVEKNLYKGVKVGNGDTMITHLQFADDTIFFEEASDENIKVVKGIMRIFELASGLKINFAKSQLMGMGVEERWTSRMAYRQCCTQGEFPFKYLGIPIGGNHRKLAMWNLYEWEADDAVELQKRIENVKIAEGVIDKWEWIHDKGGQYSTKSAYSILTKERVESIKEKTFKRIWNPILPSKISTFIWQLVLDKIPTKVNLLRRGVIKDTNETKCALCNEEEEVTTHMFLNCKIARWVWKACSKWWGSKMSVHRDCWNTFQSIERYTKGTKIKEGLDSNWKTAVWSIWIARNQKIFHNKKVNPVTLLELIQMRSFWWIKAKKYWATVSLSDWLIDPAACFKT
ncbi:hypothetical protein SLEP1_g7497 [Rubroshorea leprosula]|uniref:Reverse transcriptase domain-containing protein n=1 Tax=Rubroshorea leprosula TaxID=152421 RepID=A0AAV5HYS7_9ROSI|nr:hypothetical protein SLEP1_g7497 [Rubroshorea leprosula]